MKYVWVGLLGACGAVARWAISASLGSYLHSVFPWPILLVNVTGSLFLGLITGLGAERGLIPPAWREPLGVGFVGAYTTFSTWTVDTVRLLEEGRLFTAGANVLVSLLLGVTAAWLGLAASRLAGRPRL